MAADLRFFTTRTIAERVENAKLEQLQRKYHQLATELQNTKNLLRMAETRLIEEKECSKVCFTTNEYYIDRYVEAGLLPLINCEMCSSPYPVFGCTPVFYQELGSTHKPVNESTIYLCEPCRIARFEITPCSYYHTLNRKFHTQFFTERKETVTFMSRTKSAKK